MRLVQDQKRLQGKSDPQEMICPRPLVFRIDDELARGLEKLKDLCHVGSSVNTPLEEYCLHETIYCSSCIDLQSSLNFEQVASELCPGIDTLGT